MALIYQDELFSEVRKAEDKRSKDFVDYASNNEKLSNTKKKFDEERNRFIINLNKFIIDDLENI